MTALRVMQSGCRRSQGGTYFAFQHRKERCPEIMGEYQHVRTIPVFYPKRGIKDSMVVTECSGELGVNYSPVQLQRCNAQVRQTLRGFPQSDIWEGMPSDSKSSCMLSSSSEKINGNIGLHITPSSPHQPQVSFPSLSHQPLTDGVLPDGESQICAKIEDYIARELAKFRTFLSQENVNYGHSIKMSDGDHTLQSDCVISNIHSDAHLPTTSAADEDGERPNGINATTDFIATSEEIGGCATEKHSTEHPKVSRTAAATSTKNEDESPRVLTAVPGRTSEEPAKKQPSSMLNQRSSKEHMSERINKQKLRVLEIPGAGSGSSRDMTKTKNCAAALKKEEAKGQDRVPSSAEVLKGLQDNSSSLDKTVELSPLNQVVNTKEIKTMEDRQHWGVTCQRVVSLSKSNLSDDKHLIKYVSFPTIQSTCQRVQTNTRTVLSDAGAAHVETDLSIALSENKVEIQAPLSESDSEEALKPPLYENITDNDEPQLATEIPHTEHGELSSTACYEDISEEESPDNEIVDVERSSPTQEPEPRDKQASVGNKGYGNVQGPTQMETEFVSDEEPMPKEEESPKIERLAISQDGFVETDGGFEDPIYPKCNSERQTNRCVSCSPSSVSNDEDETDVEINDDYLVIPITVSALKFEAENEDQDSPERCVSLPSSASPPSNTSPTPWPSQKQVPAAAFPLLEVFETTESFLQAKTLQFRKKNQPDAPDVEMEPHIPWNRRESSDSCDTDDSCDYPSTPGNKFLIMSRLLKRSATDDTVIISDTEDETDNFVNTAPGEQPHSSDKEADSSLSPNYGVARLLVVKPSLNNKSFKLLKERKVHGKSSDGAQPAKTFTASHNKTGSCEKDEPHLDRNKKARLEETAKKKRHHVVKDSIQGSLRQPRMDSSQVSLPRRDGPSATCRSLSPTSEKLSEARKSSVSAQASSPPSESSNSSRIPTSKQSTSMPRQHSFPSQLRRSHSTSSTLIHSSPPKKSHSDSGTMELSARERLKRECANNFIPVRRNRKSSRYMEEDFRMNDLSREPRPGPSQHDRAPRQRHGSLKHETPLMKKTRTDAMQWTKAINKDLKGERRSSVGEGYKWSEKPSKADHFPEFEFSSERWEYRSSP